MNSISDLDFRDLKPSVAKWLGRVIEDDAIHSAVVDRLRNYLDRLDISQPSASDQATALSHELAALGVWEKIDEQLFVKGLASSAPSKIKTLLSAAPLALEERLMEAGNREPEGKRSLRYLVRKRKGSGKLSHSGTMRFFTVDFQSQRVEGSLKIRGVSLSAEEKVALCRILDMKTKMYVAGLAWSVGVGQSGGSVDFSIGELASPMSRGNILIGRTQRHGAMAVETGVAGQYIWPSKLEKGFLPNVKRAKGAGD